MSKQISKRPGNQMVAALDPAQMVVASEDGTRYLSIGASAHVILTAANEQKAVFNLVDQNLGSLSVIPLTAIEGSRVTQVVRGDFIKTNITTGGFMKALKEKLGFGGKQRKRRPMSRQSTLSDDATLTDD